MRVRTTTMGTPAEQLDRDEKCALHRARGAFCFVARCLPVTDRDGSARLRREHDDQVVAIRRDFAARRAALTDSTPHQPNGSARCRSL